MASIIRPTRSAQQLPTRGPAFALATFCDQMVTAWNRVWLCGVPS